jgi:hypothetical protein
LRERLRAGSAWEVFVAWKTLTLRVGPEDELATLVVFPATVSDPARYYVAGAGETRFVRDRADVLDDAAFALLESLAKSRPGIVAGTPGPEDGKVGHCLSDAAIRHRLKVVHYSRRNVTIKDARDCIQVHTCVMRHRTATLGARGITAVRDGDAYVVRHLGGLIQFLPGEIGHMFRSGNGSDADGPVSDYRITQHLDGRGWRIPVRVMTAGFVHALATDLVPEMQRALDGIGSLDLGWRQKRISDIMKGAEEVPDDFWAWFKSLPPNGLKFERRQALATMANGTAARWHPTRGDTPDPIRYEEVRSKTFDTAIQMRPDLEPQVAEARVWRRMSASAEQVMDRYNIPTSPGYNAKRARIASEADGAENAAPPKR